MTWGAQATTSSTDSKSRHTVIDPYVRQRVVRCCHISLRWTSEFAASSNCNSWFPTNCIAANHHLTAGLARVNICKMAVKTRQKLHIISSILGKSALNVARENMHPVTVWVFQRIYQTSTKYYEILRQENTINVTIHNFLYTFAKWSLAPSIVNPFWLVSTWARDLYAANYNYDKHYRGK